ncbi:MAG: 50S ribosomal protein L11 methyltransferase [Oscillospiraceae bacterium]|nr:50S ribosomal protein L11 methyltransferase [Oscillospiraceae bacterium]
MRYIECCLDTAPEEIDARCEELSALGVGGFVVESEEDFQSFLENNRQYWDYVDADLEERFRGLSRLKFYLTDDADGLGILQEVRARFPAVRQNTVEDADWENNWRSYYQPIEVGEKLVVVPEWEEIPEGNRLPLRLDPGLTFGTGSHATTRLCLQALENWAGPGRRVLDLGCGSGILGIGALILGCDSCLGVDIDPKSPDVAAENAALNGLTSERIRFLSGDLLKDASLRRSLGSGYDIVLANIVADVILPLSPHVPAFLKPNGVYITSGIIEGRQDEVQRALEASGFRILSHTAEDDWHCFVATPRP